MGNKILIGAAAALFAGVLGFIVYRNVVNSKKEVDFTLVSGTKVNIEGTPELQGTYVFGDDEVKTPAQVEARMNEIVSEAQETWKSLFNKECDLSEWYVIIQKEFDPKYGIANGYTDYSMTKKFLLFKSERKHIHLLAKPFGDWRHEIGHACMVENFPEIKETVRGSVITVQHCWMWKHGYESTSEDWKNQCIEKGLW